MLGLSTIYVDIGSCTIKTLVHFDCFGCVLKLAKIFFETSTLRITTLKNGNIWTFLPLAHVKVQN